MPTPRSHLDRPSVLAVLAVLAADLRDRWRRGEPVLVEAYLRHLSGLGDDTDAVLELVRTEWALRADAGEQPDLVDYQKRFPAAAPALAREVERWRRSAGALADGSVEGRLTWSAADGHRFVAPGGFDTPPLPPAPATEPAPASGERYVVTRLQGEGGLGQVFVARDRDLNREVALKRVRPERAESSGGRWRLLQEAQVTGQLEHPNIVPVYDLDRGAEDGRPYYVMRLVRGRSLQDEVADYHRHRRDGAVDPLEQPRLLGAFVAVCHAIAYAHSRGTLHRDLKPANVVLGPFGEVQVLDWGLAKVVGEPDESGGASGVTVSQHAQAGETLPGSIIGTPGYLAPEQASGEADARSDVYGLGAILFEILTGRPPHHGRTIGEVLQSTRAGLTPRPRAVDPTVPRPLDAVCARALAPAPDDRYQSATELADDIQRYLADEPVSAWREPAAVRARRWVARHRALVGTAGSAGVLLVTGLVVATVLLTAAYDRERAARADAQHHADVARGERDRAAANFRLARRAVEQYLDRVSESPELKARGLERLRRDLLQTAVDFQQELIRQQGDDPAIRAERGRAFWRLGTITRDIGTPADALALLHSAREIQEELVVESPADPAPREDLGKTLNQLGNVSADAGKVTEAEAFYDRALTTRRELADSQPDVSDRKAELASTLNNLGNLYRLTGRWDRADDAYGEAVRLFDAVRQAAPDAETHRRGLALALNNLGVLQLDMGRPDEALKSHDRAMGHWSAVVKLAPDVPEYRVGQANGHLNRGMAFAAAEQVSEAEAAYRSAIAQLQALADEHPHVGDFRSALALAWGNLSIVLADARRAEALAARKTALVILTKLVAENPGVLEYRRALAGAHGNLGALLAMNPADRPAARAALDESLRLREELAAANPDLPQAQSDLAGALTNLAASDVMPLDAAATYAKRALEFRQRLADKYPAVPEYAAEVARAHNNIGTIALVRGQSGEAAAALDRSREVWDRLVKAYPAVVAYRHELAAYHFNRGLQARNARRMDRAADEFTAARTLWTELGRQRPAVPKYREHLARTNLQLAPLVREGPGPVDARLAATEALYREAIGLWEELGRQHPAETRYAPDLGKAYYGLGSLLGLHRLSPADALPWYDKAIATLRPPVRHEGMDSDAGRQLYLSLFGRAVALGFLKQYPEELRAWGDVVEAASGANRPDAINNRNIALARYANHLTRVAREGKVADAIEQARVIDTENELPGPAAEGLARLYAVAAARTKDPATANRYLTRATEYLDAARTAGAFKDPAARQRLKEDRDLDSLRDTDAYRRAVAEPAK